MTNQTLEWARRILLVLILVLLGATGFLYFRKGTFNFAGVFIALGCFMIYLVTARKQGSGRQ